MYANKKTKTYIFYLTICKPLNILNGIAHEISIVIMMLRHSNHKMKSPIERVLNTGKSIQALIVAKAPLMIVNAFELI